MNVPASGSRVIFDVVPAGSYASPGVTYLVTHYGKRTINLTNEATGSSTQDAPVMYRRAAWRDAPAAA